MRKRVRNEPDSGPAAEGAMVTYSRLPRGGRGPAERREPILEAREVPYRDDDLRAYDPERAAGGLDEAIDDLEMPRRRRGRKPRRGGRAAILVGALALAAGMVILAYAYGIATRLDAPSSLSAGASASAPAGPADAGTTRGTLPADDAARSIPVPVKGESSAPVPSPSPKPAAPEGNAGAAQPATESASAPPSPSGAHGTPMDGDGAQPSGAAQPALVAPVPATKTPAAPAAAPPPKAADAKPVDSGDDLINNIERLLARDGATAGASGQPGDSSAESAGPTLLSPPPQSTAVSDPNGLPALPDPNAPAARLPANAGSPNRLIPPADIPNVPPSDTSNDLGPLH